MAFAQVPRPKSTQLDHTTKVVEHRLAVTCGEALEAELNRANVVEPREIPPGVFTMK